MELRLWLELYKSTIGTEKLEVGKVEHVQVGQVRILLWQPWEYILVASEETEKLYKCFPLTILTDLTTTTARIFINKKVLAPLPFHVYVRQEVLERESIVEGSIDINYIKDIEKSVSYATLEPYVREKREFIRLVWKRYRDLTLSSILYTHIKMEEEEKLTAVIDFVNYYSLAQRLVQSFGAYRLVAEGSKYLRGSNWYGVVEEGKLIIYLPEDLIDRKIKVRLMDETIYEGLGQERIIFENFPSLSDYEPLEENIHVEVSD